MDSIQIAEDDAQIIKTLEDVTYFNVEVSDDMRSFDHSSLVFNASKKGIDVFLKMYGHLESPPEVISLENLKRPTRKWLSPRILENEKATPQDPTPYKAADINGYDWNLLLNSLWIELLKDDEDHPILCAGIRDRKPLLIVNKKGWQKFLKLLQCLRDRSYWFFVTAVNPSWSHLPFQLTTPYRGEAGDHVFRAIEFIRLEPTEDIYLNTSPNYMHATCTGLLLLSHWIHSFAMSQEMEKDICNRWSEFPANLKDEVELTPPCEPESPPWIYLRKVKLDSPYPIFSLEKKEGDEIDNLYIFGNVKGFKELAEVIEEFAFSSDHDLFSSSPPEQHRRGDIVEGGLGPEGFQWQILSLAGGGKFTPKYNPLRFNGTLANPDQRSEFEIEKNFINERILLTDDIP